MKRNVLSKECVGERNLNDTKLKSKLPNLFSHIVTVIEKKWYVNYDAIIDLKCRLCKEETPQLYSLKKLCVHQSKVFKVFSNAG